MTPSHPFVDPETNTLDTGRIADEATPLAKLIAVVAAVAAVPLVVLWLLSPLFAPQGALFVLLAQFVLAVGAGVVLLYVISRAIQLAEE